MRIVSVTAVCLYLMFTYGTTSFARDIFDGRDLAWGMTREAVKAAEPGRELSWEEYISPNEMTVSQDYFDYYAFFQMDEPFWGIRPGKICYGFWGAPGDVKKLGMVYYTFTPYTENHAAMVDYQKLQDMLKTRFGQPYIEGWRDNGEPVCAITETVGLQAYLHNDAKSRALDYLQLWLALAQWHTVDGELNILTALAENNGLHYLWLSISLAPEGPTSSSWLNAEARQ